MPRSGTVPSLFFAACFLAATHTALGATKEPPYAAVVESDEAFFRCGPGKNFYPTGKLKRGDRVTVRRHDPGGWFMIDPPAGSFSLVPCDEVAREGDAGTIKPLAEGQTPVRIGSTIDPTIDSVYQRQLSSGERVEILGETTVAHRNTQVQMLKIRSPKGEFRWIEGMNLTPIDQQIQDQQIRDQQARYQRSQPSGDQTDSDPFAAGPPSQKSPPLQSLPAVRIKPAGKQTGQPAASPSGANSVAGQPTTRSFPPTQSRPPTEPATAPVDPYSRLQQIDLQFRDTIQRPATTWNLAQIEQAYRELSQQPLSVAMRGQLDLRFSAVEHYKQVKGEYDDYFRLVSNTARKDAELAAIQYSLDPRDARPPIGQPGQVPISTEPSSNTPPSNTPPSNPVGGPSIPLPTVSVPNAQASPNLPEFNPSSPPSAPPQGGGRHAVGPVLENPVPLPTEPQPEAGPRREIQPESPIASPQTAAPNDTGPTRELPIQPTPPAVTDAATGPTTHAPATQMPQYPAGNPAESPLRPAPSNVSVAPTPPTRTQPMINREELPLTSQPAMASPLTSPMAPSPTQGTAQIAPNVPTLAAPRQIRPQAAGGLDGAGIVQLAATPIPGGPRHVLLAPNGRILAYLYPDRGINLDPYIGRSMGIVGPRAFRPELRTDLIVVRGMVPVRLTP